MILWSEYENRLAVMIYTLAGMLGLGRKEVLALCKVLIPGRTRKAHEYRLKNISEVLKRRGLEWLPDWPPSEHVGDATVVAQIERFLMQPFLRVQL